MSDNQWISMVVPSVNITHLTEDKSDEIMAVQADDTDFSGHDLACSSVFTTTSSDGLSAILKDVMDMEYEEDQRKSLLRDPSPFEDLKSSGTHQVYRHTCVNHESDVNNAEPLDSEWVASIQIRNVVDMVETRYDGFRNELQRYARNQNQSQAGPRTSVAAPLEEHKWDAVQELGNKQVKVFENATKSRFVQKQYFGKPKEREIEVLKAMKHQSIPTLYDSWMQGNSTILRMEYCGKPLARHVEKYFNEGSYVQETFIWNILEQMMKLLGYLELAKVVHQNISCETICLQPTRKGLLVKLVGFGNVLTYQDLVPQSGIQSTAGQGGTVQDCEADDLATRTVTLSGSSLFWKQGFSEALLTGDRVQLTGSQRWKSSNGSDEASRPSCQADMVACGRVALFMVYGPGHVKDLNEALGKCFPKRYSNDLKDLIKKMVDLNPQTGLKPATGLEIIQNKLGHDVIDVSDSDEATELSDGDQVIELSGSDGNIELSDNDQVIELSDSDGDIKLSGNDEGAVEPTTNGVTPFTRIPISPQLQTPLQQRTFSFQKNCDSPRITPLVSTAGTVGSSFDRPDDVVSVNPRSSWYQEPYKEIPWNDRTQSQADKGTLNKLRSRVTGNQGSRDKPYIRPQTKYTNLPDIQKLIN